ncbi:hypothetical protein LXL04_029992 [Taraxacum kok-saghyz]
MIHEHLLYLLVWRIIYRAVEFIADNNLPWCTIYRGGVFLFPVLLLSRAVFGAGSCGSGSAWRSGFEVLCFSSVAADFYLGRICPYLRFSAALAIAACRFGDAEHVEMDSVPEHCINFIQFIPTIAKRNNRFTR